MAALVDRRDDDMAAVAARAHDRFAALHQAGEAVLAEIGAGKLERRAATAAEVRVG